MASGDFLDLQNNLAILAGRASASELDEDLALCKQVINEALLEIYRPLDEDGAPIIPEWTRRTVALQFRAPAEITLAVTNGSSVVSGYSFPDDCIGSLVKIGTRYYRYAGSSQSATSSVIVSGAGTAAVNGVYWPIGEENGQPVYYKNRDTESYVMVFNGDYWAIFASARVIEIYFNGSDTVPYGVVWALNDGDSPAPTVTQGYDYYLVEPVLESTGSYDATLYHTSQPFPADVAEIVGGVEWQGRGLLSPMTDRETDVGYRANTMGDYHPDYGGGYFGALFVGVTGTGYPSGDPRFYYVETDALLEGTAVLRRLALVPCPSAAANIIMRCNVLPVELSADTDRPKIVGDLSTRCLFPLAREKWGILYKKYTGQNQSALIREGDRARAMLRGMAKPQKRSSGRATVSMR